MKKFRIFLNQYLILVLIIFVAVVLRLYKIDNPIADWHSWRQSDTAAVSRSFYQEGFNPFIPKYDDMVSVGEILQANPNRYRFVEFPIYNTIVYLGYLVNGGVDVRIDRLVSIIFSSLTTVWVFLITRRYLDSKTGVLAAALFAILPFSVYYGRVVLPEPVLVFFCLGMIYFCDRWIYENRLWQYFLSLVFIMVSFLLKPMAVFFLIPLIFSYYKKETKLWPIPIRYWLLFVPALIPFGLWRIWMQRFPEGIPMSNWLLNGNNIRWRPAFWYWIIGERFGGVILGPTGVALLVIGSIVKFVKNESYFLLYFLFGMMVYLLTFATGNVQHDYYQYLIIPAVCIIVARGVMLLVFSENIFLPKVVTVPLAVLLLGLTIYLPFTKVKGYYQINNWSIVEAGREADKILPKDAIVVASYMGDSSFLYQTNRNGWALLTEGVEDLKDKYNLGFYLSTAKDADTVDLMKKYQVMVDNPRYVIIDVRGNPK